MLLLDILLDSFQEIFEGKWEFTKYIWILGDRTLRRGSPNSLDDV